MSDKKEVKKPCKKDCKLCKCKKKNDGHRQKESNSNQ
jgi:hypothetical protein